MKKLKIYFLSGLSESGKSHAGEFAIRFNIYRLKIMYFEKLIAKINGLEMRDKKEVEKTLQILYKNETKMYDDFRNYIYEFMILNKCFKVSLESLYRSGLAESFFEDERFETNVVFIEANFKKRVDREYKKRLEKEKITIKQIETETKEKDNFKILNGVLKVKKIATNVVKNDATVEEFENQLTKIYERKRV